ncbi:MAG: hypothetical protein AB7O49_10300 [Sphingomonadales bacterium]
MAKFNDAWKVPRHGALERLDDGLLTVAGEIRMKLGNFPRRMTVAALAGGRTAIWSAMPLREPEMAEIESLGAPAYLIVPGIAHRLDVRAWKARYPEARVVCAPGARDAVSKAVAVDATGNVLGDPAVRLETVPGVDGMEAALLVRRNGRVTVVLNDVLAHVRHPRGIGAQLMARLLGFGVNRPNVPRTARMLLVKDVKALALGFRHWAAEPGLARVVVSHGDVIADRPRSVLERAAEDLERSL